MLSPCKCRLIILLEQTFKVKRNVHVLKHRDEQSRDLGQAFSLSPWPQAGCLPHRQTSRSPAHQQLDLKAGSFVGLLQATLLCSRIFTRLLLEVWKQGGHLLILHRPEGKSGYTTRPRLQLFRSSIISLSFPSTPSRVESIKNIRRFLCHLMWWTFHSATE